MNSSSFNHVILNPTKSGIPNYSLTEEDFAIMWCKQCLHNIFGKGVSSRLFKAKVPISWLLWKDRIADDYVSVHYERLDEKQNYKNRQV